MDLQTQLEQIFASDIRVVQDAFNADWPEFRLVLMDFVRKNPDRHPRNEKEGVSLAFSSWFMFIWLDRPEGVQMLSRWWRTALEVRSEWVDEGFTSFVETIVDDFIDNARAIR